MSRVIYHGPYTKFEEVFATSEGMQAPKAYSFDPAYIAADDDATKVVHPGMFVAKMANGKARLLARAKLATATSASPAVVLNSAETAKAFYPTDVVYALPPYAVITFTATWADGDTAEVVLNGIAVAYVVAGYSTLAALATTYAAILNADARFAAIATAIASGAAVYIYANDMKSLYSIATTATTVGDGTLPVTGGLTALAYNNTALGTIAANGVDPTAATLTLGANAAVTGLPVGFPVGVRNGEIVGLLGSPHDFTATRTHPGDGALEVGVYSAAAVYAARLPYLDGEIKAKLPNLIFV